MIFIFNFISEKFTDIRKNHRKNPNKLRIILLWVTFIIILTVLFYHFGAFDNKINKNPITQNVNQINKPLKLINAIKQKPINNSFRNKKPDKKIYEIIPKENIDKINSILSEVKKMPVPQNYTNDDYNFE